MWRTLTNLLPGRGSKGIREVDSVAAAERHEAGRDTLGTLDDWETGDRGRANRVAVRFLAFALVVSLLANYAQTTFIINAWPFATRTVPWLVKVKDNHDAVIEMEPLKRGTSQMILLAKKYATDYVRLRNEIVSDPVEMNRRWGTGCLEDPLRMDERMCAFVAKHSAPAVYRSFVELVDQKKVQKMFERRESRQVSFALSEPLQIGHDQFELRFTLTDVQHIDGPHPTVIRKRKFVAKVWWAFCRGAFVTRRCPPEAQKPSPRNERFLNPEDFWVTGYQQTPVTEEKAPVSELGTKKGEGS